MSKFVLIWWVARSLIAADPTPDPSCQKSFADLFFSTQNGHFYVAMKDWGTSEWYQKSLAKAYQARLIGVPRTVESVALKDIGFLHPIDTKFGNGRTYRQTIDRSKLMIDFLKKHPEFRDIDAHFQTHAQLSRDLSAAAESEVKLSTGFRLPNGEIVLIDGNGRLAAWRIAMAEIAGNGKAPELTMDINVIDWKDAPPGTGELIAFAQGARGGKGWNPTRPDQVNAKLPERILVNGKSVALNQDNAIRAYYEALSDLVQAQENGVYQSPTAGLYKATPVTGTDTWRQAEGAYRVPPDMIRFAPTETGGLQRFSSTGPVLKGEAAKLTARDLKVGEKYLFVVDSSGGIRVAPERALEGEPRNRKHGDLVPSELRPDIAKAIQSRAEELTGTVQEGGSRRSRDEAVQDALAEILFHQPTDRAAYNRAFEAAFKDIDESVRAANLTLPPVTIARKARLRALNELELLKEPLTRVYVASKEGSVRGLARIGGGFKVVEAQDGTGDFVVVPNLNSSYAFARLDGTYHDTAEVKTQVASSLRGLFGDGIRIQTTP